MSRPILPKPTTTLPTSNPSIIPTNLTSSRRISLQRSSSMTGSVPPPHPKSIQKTITKAKTARARKNMDTPKRIRITAKNLGLTFPQTEMSKEEALRNFLQGCNSPVLAVVIARELHKDGSHHLHFAVCFANTVKIDTEEDPFGYVVGKRGNYQGLRSLQNWLLYIQKDDKTPLIHGDLDGLTSNASKPSKSTAVANMIRSGSSLVEVEENDPGFFLFHQKKINEYLAFTIQKQQRSSIKPPTMPIRYTGEDESTMSIIDWLNTNLFLTARRFKSPQLYLHGPPNSCKSLLAMRLSERCRTHFLMMNEDYYDSFDNEADLVILDEFKSQKTIQFLNNFLDGSRTTLRAKGFQIQKTKNIPVIILSNYSPFHAYKTDAALEKLDTLLARLKVVELFHPIDIDNIHFDPVELTTSSSSSSSSTVSSPVPAPSPSILVESSQALYNEKDEYLELDTSPAPSPSPQLNRQDTTVTYAILQSRLYDSMRCVNCLHIASHHEHDCLCTYIAYDTSRLKSTSISMYRNDYACCDAQFIDLTEDRCSRCNFVVGADFGPGHCNCTYGAPGLPHDGTLIPRSPVNFSPALPLLRRTDTELVEIDYPSSPLI